ncbi:LANO_0H00848g1_1 [Lachancea nothofagi CBS 11611]|uniref:LANO_0H00848g1_1 n=1 Tax=Lachancea nothofagi CBS 11611 TaxID=1266666 RepID=A0A1G4KL38_9SACH|nr:LANO_0H00848g1_1 [Lachancea nothofagi CBS 11611]
MLNAVQSSLRISPSRTSRLFHTYNPLKMFQVGDVIKTGLAGVQENSPGNAVDIGKEVSKGKHIIVGVPAAFSPACTASHVPGYIAKLDELKKKGVENVFITCVNDAFVTKAWSDSLKTPKDVHVLADTRGEFAKSGNTLFDSEEVFGNKRNYRYAIIVDNGKVVAEFEEPDKTGVNVSSAENVLKAL